MPTKHELTTNKLFPDDVIFQSENFTIAQDWEVPIPGFYIIASKRPMRSILELNNLEIVELANVQKIVRRGMLDVLGIVDVYFFQNEDSAHGFHIWAFPRHSWMDRFGRKVQSIRPIIDYAVSQMANELVFTEIRTANRNMKGYLVKMNLLNEAESGREKVLQRNTSNRNTHQLPLV